jgi:hypothetical protein
MSEDDDEVAKILKKYERREVRIMAQERKRRVMMREGIVSKVKELGELELRRYRRSGYEVMHDEVSEVLGRVIKAIKEYGV